MGSDSSLVGVPCKCVRDCGSTGVSSNVYDTYSMIPRGAVDVRVHKENWACEVVRHVPGPSTPEACAQAVLAESTCSKKRFTWSDSSLVGVPCKCVRDCGSTGVSSNVYDTYSMIPRGTARRSLRRSLKK